LGGMRVSGNDVKRSLRGSAKERMRRPPVRSLLVTVILLSLGLVIVTLVNYYTAVRVADETLRNQGVSIGLELAAEARGISAKSRSSPSWIATARFWRTRTPAS
jgi:cell division protein FtsX